MNSGGHQQPGRGHRGGASADPPLRPVQTTILATSSRL